MGLMEKLFGKKEQPAAVKAQHTFQLLDGYTPAFHTWNGSIFESDLIRAALDAHGRRLVDLVIDAELERMVATPVVVEFPRPMIQHFLVPAAAGYASPIEGEEYEMIPLPDDAPDDADFCITVRGDSMEPKLHDGDLAFVRRGAPLNEYDVGVFYVSGDVLIKRWHVDRRGILHLTGLNPAAQGANRIIPVSSQDTVVCFGKVITKTKKPPRGEA